MHSPTGDLERLERALRQQWKIEAVTADLSLMSKLQPVLRKGKWEVTVAVHKGHKDEVARIVEIWPGLHEAGCTVWPLTSARPRSRRT